VLALLAAPLTIKSPIPITFVGAATSGVVDGRYAEACGSSPTTRLWT